MFYAPRISSYFQMAWTLYPILSAALTILGGLIGLSPVLYKLTKKSFPLTKYAYTLYQFNRGLIEAEYQITKYQVDQLLVQYEAPLRKLIEYPWSDPPFNRRIKPKGEEFKTLADFLKDHGFQTKDDESVMTNESGEFEV